MSQILNPFPTEALRRTPTPAGSKPAAVSSTTPPPAAAGAAAGTSKPKMLGVEPDVYARHNGPGYRTPMDLQVTPMPGARFLVVGACLAQAFPQIAALLNPQWKGDFHLLNHFDSFPPMTEEQAAAYDFQIVHIPLRSILGSAYFRLPDDGSKHEEFLRETQDYLSRYLANALKLTIERAVPAFVLGFMIPQQNPMGRFQPRYDLRNVMHFIERLNMFLAAELGKYRNAHFVDVDQLSAGIGKKYCQDDMVWSFTHGTSLSDGDHDHDLTRIQPRVSMQHFYTQRWMDFFEVLLREVFTMYRITLQLDAVKLVAVDLDDTMWRGVAAEGTLGILEGWPMGFMETLLYLKKRGILLAIVSKNSEEFIRSNWDKIVHGQIAWEDFAVRKINFQSKAVNLTEIIQEVNLRAQNVVMVDDNPVERAAVKEQLPGVRVLGSHLYYLKRILLWSAETQQPVLTSESGRKTEMVQAQLHREEARKALSHEEFLQTLNLEVSISVIRDAKDLHLNRALELFNKTNQFNTTGRRYTLAQFNEMLAAGRELFVMQAADRFTQYGLIGAAWVEGDCVEHLVLSCRAIGLGIEETFLARLGEMLSARGVTAMRGRLIYTEANLACRELYRRNGFVPESGDLWGRELAVGLKVPGHVKIGA